LLSRLQVEIIPPAAFLSKKAFCIPINAPPIGNFGGMEKLICKRCESNFIVKCDIRNNIQRYQCCVCKAKMQFTYCERSDNKEKKQQALELYLEGLGIRSIGRYLKVSHVSILNWLMKTKIPTWIRPLKVKVIEIDEVYFYVGNKKKRCWLWLAVCRESKRILAHQIGKRNRPTVRKLLQKISGIECLRYYTDAHLSYKRLFPKDKHRESKKYTYTVEGINSYIRHFLARFRRRSKCYSKNEEVADKSITLLGNRLHERYVREFSEAA
jgi:insertion element IS1 protein InsB